MVYPMVHDGETQTMPNGPISQSGLSFGCAIPMLTSRVAFVMRRIVFTAALALALICAAPSFAADKIAVGKGQSFVFSFNSIDLGIEKGIFKKYGFDEVRAVDFAGDGKVQQAMIAGDVQFGL